MNRDGGYIVKRSIAITPSDSANIEPRPDALLVGGAGNLAVEWDDGSTDTLTGLLAGNIYPISPKRIHSTSTTATDISALYFDVKTPGT